RNSATLDDALRYVSGVNMMQDQVNIRGSSGYSRGVGSRVLILLDGLPFTTGDTGEINWETIPVHQVERIEVVKGAGSALYGSSALGGVINVITRSIPDVPVLHVRAFSGLYGRPGHAEWNWWSRERFNSGLAISGSGRSGNLSGLASLSRSVDESHRANDVYHRWSGFLKLRYELSETQGMVATVNILRRTHGNFFWWRSLKEATVPATNQLDGSVFSNRGNVTLEFKEFLSDRMYYVIKGMYFGNFWRDDSAGRVGNISASHVGQFDAQLTADVGQGTIVTAGIAGKRDVVNSNLFGQQSGMGAAVYLQGEVRIGDAVIVTAGTRFDYQKVSSIAGVSRLSPKLGITYSPTSSTTLRGSFGTRYR
ncbi:MAG: TonB-dependent receptor, partial [Bacteroidota bacterium]